MSLDPSTGNGQYRHASILLLVGNEPVVATTAEDILVTTVSDPGKSGSSFIQIGRLLLNVGQQLSYNDAFAPGRAFRAELRIAGAPFGQLRCLHPGQLVHDWSSGVDARFGLMLRGAFLGAAHPIVIRFATDRRPGSVGYMSPADAREQIRMEQIHMAGYPSPPGQYSRLTP